MKSTFSIKGMTCSNCSNSITSALKDLDGVVSVDISLLTEEGVIVHDEEKVTAGALQAEIEDCGFDAELLSEEKGTIQDSEYLTRIHVDGMTCSNCTQAITKAIQQEDAVSSVEVSLLTQEAIIHHNSSVASAKLKDIIEDCGFDAYVLDSNKISNQSTENLIETILEVKGMTCGACSTSISTAVGKLEGVQSCSVSLLTEQANVLHTDSVTPNTIKDEIEDCGFDAAVIDSKRQTNSTLESTVFLVQPGVTESQLEFIKSLPGVDGLDFSDLSNEKLKIIYNPHEIGVRTLKNKIGEHGVLVVPLNKVDMTQQLSSLNKSKEIIFWRRAFKKTLLIGLPLFIVSHVLPALDVPFEFHLYHGIYAESILEFQLATWVQFGELGQFFYSKAWNSIRHGAGTMDLLVSISTTISWVFSVFTLIIWFFKDEEDMSPHTLFETSVLLLNFVSLGKWMENKAKSETSFALSKLINLASNDCVIVENFDLENPVLLTIPINYLQINDIIFTRPGEKIPSDGIILKGESEVNESLITGESIPIFKKPQDKVIGGSVNSVGNIFIKVTSTSENSQLSQIIKMVKSAQMNKAPIQSYADWVASIFVPTIITLATLTFICWLIICEVITNLPPIFQDGVNSKFYICLKISISVIVVACPCALGLAAPTAMMVGTGVGASNGVLIKGGEALEISNDINTILFDKTGTLTVGQMTVSKFTKISPNFQDEIELLDAIGNIESRSEHPIGAAISKYAQDLLQDGIFKSNISNVEIKIGQGIEAFNDSKLIKIGNSRLIKIPESLKAQQLSESTLVHVQIDDEYIGFFEIADVLKSDAIRTLKTLSDNGYEIAMVTGDSQITANSIASKIGIPLRNVYSEITPFGKEQLVKDLQLQGYKVAFVGDGINDSPALACADLGIAIASGTDIAVQAADIVIINRDFKLCGVVYALDISKATLRRIKWNFFWSWIYNVTMLPIAMGVLSPWGIQLPPLAAAASMMFSSVSVVISSLLLKRWRPPALHDGEGFGDEFTPKRRVGWKEWLLRRPLTQDIELQTNLLNNQ